MIFYAAYLNRSWGRTSGHEKGIIELADAIIVHKADGSNKERAEQTKHEYNQILHFLQPATKGWVTKAYTCSSLTQEGISEIWRVIQSFEKNIKVTGVFEDRRRSQVREWLYSMITDQLHFLFYHHIGVRGALPKLENEVISGGKTVAAAVETLMDIFISTKKT